MQYNQYPYSEGSAVSNFMYKVYGWMSFALAVTAGVSYYMFTTKNFFYYLMSHPWSLFGLIIFQFAMVIALSFFIMRMSVITAIIAFVLYAASVGLTMASIFFVYTNASIFATFLVTAGTFLVMALYGYFTKKDLSSWGSFLLMALLGIIIGMFVNMFLKSSSFDYFISAIGVLIFTLLTAYDTQKIKMLGSKLVDQEVRSKIAILGALTLYLDFINLFLFLLRFMGNRRES